MLSQICQFNKANLPKYLGQYIYAKWKYQAKAKIIHSTKLYCQVIISQAESPSYKSAGLKLKVTAFIANNPS